MTKKQEWELICRTFCRQRGYTLLFANADNMDLGFEDKDGHMWHIDADELAAMLGYKG